MWHADAIGYFSNEQNLEGDICLAKWDRCNKFGTVDLVVRTIVCLVDFLFYSGGMHLLLRQVMILSCAINL